MNNHSLHTYLSDHYGICIAGHCRCRCSRPKCDCGGGVWLGTMCKDWNSSNAKNYEELVEFQKRIRNGSNT